MTDVAHRPRGTLAASGRVTTAAAPLRGRAAELALLDEHLARLADGVGFVWLIEADPGLGKSRLLRQVQVRAHAAGFAVGHGAADPGEAAVELAVLFDALFGGTEPVLKRAALPPAPTSRERRYWLIQDIEALLEQVALRRPVVLCLDDVQWADGGSLAALRLLPARLACMPVGWVLAFRPVDRDGDAGRAISAAAEAATTATTTTTTLRRLEASAVAEVAADMLGATPDPDLLDLAESARGNPFQLTELLGGLRDEQLIQFDAGRVLLVESRLPERVKGSMRRRLGRLTATARQIAAVASCLGRRFTLSQLACVLGEPPSALIDGLAELIGTGLIIEDADALRFSHDLNREAVRASLPRTTLPALDRQVAAALLAAGAMPVEVATQLAASAAPGDEVAIATLMKASDAISDSDPGRAADLARRALDLTTRQHQLRGPLIARTAVLLHAAARSKEAKAFADGALGQALPPDQEAEVRLSIASLFAISPEVRAASCRSALALDGLPPALRARLLAQLFHNLVVAVRPEEARQLAPEVSAAIASSDDRAAPLTFELGQASLDYMAGHFEASLARVDTFLQRSSDPGEGSRERLARHLRCGILVVIDRFDEALTAAADGVSSAQQARQAWALHLFQRHLGRQYLQRGQLADAAAVLEGDFGADDAHLVVSVVDAAAVVALGRVALHTSDHRQAELTGSIAQVMLTSGVPGVERHAAWLLALQAMAQGDPAGARRRLATLGEAERLSVFPLFPLDPADDPQLVRIAIASGDTELAESVTRAARHRSQLNPGTTGLAAGAAHAGGLLDADTEQLAAAAVMLATGPRRLALASALEDLGGAHLLAGRADDAVAAFDGALRHYAECGARWDAGRVRSRLRRLGVRRRLAAERRPTAGWAAMTDAELAVVRLAADGLTNKEIAERLYISAHTVSGHLRHAFEKLAVHSRVALTRLAAEHDRT
jgi:DNA-binding CsgD family transcriptional regulator